MEQRCADVKMKELESAPRAKKQMSLSPQTVRIRARLAEWQASGRRHWDLFRYLYDPHVLADATRLVLKNAGSSGIDNKTCAEVRKQGWEFVKELSHKLKTKTYHPSMVRRVYIPKRDGRERPLGIPTVEDRVVQRALVILLEPIYERIFLPCSYGFRPDKRAVECVSHVSQHVYTHRLVFEADIESFFDAVSHNKLLGMLKKQVVDMRVLTLVRDILKSGYFDVRTGRNATEQGTPQGGPLSPLLANLYLHYVLDSRFADVAQSNKGMALYRYADDFVVVCQTEKDLNFIRKLITTWMHEGGLTLKEKKTRVVDMRNQKRGHNSKFDFLGYKFHLRAFSDNKERYWVARQPSETARKQLRQNLRSKLHPFHSEVEAKEKIEEVWYGWSEYFRYGNSNRVFYREINSVSRAILFYLRRKYRQQRKPVPWRKLLPKWKAMKADIHPLSVKAKLL